MSWQATTWVIEHSKHKGSELLTMLMIANCANESGGDCWPSKERLMKDTRMSKRQIDRMINRLEDGGELEVRRSDGRHPNHYSFPMMHPNPVKMTGFEKSQPRHSDDRVNPAKSGTNPAIAMTPEQSLEQSSKQSEKKREPDTPAIILAIGKLAGWKPAKDTWATLAEQFPAPIDEDLLKLCYTTWRLKGWRRDNLTWLTKWYAQGGPDEYQPNGNGKPTPPVLKDGNGAIIVADYGSHYFVESCANDGGTSPRWRTAAGMAKQRDWTMEEVYAYRAKEFWPPDEKYPFHEDTIGGGDRPISIW